LGVRDRLDLMVGYPALLGPAGGGPAGSGPAVGTGALGLMPRVVLHEALPLAPVAAGGRGRSGLGDRGRRESAGGGGFGWASTIDFIGTPTWSSSWPPDSWSPRAMAVADTDGDGQPELLVARSSDQVEVFDVLTGTVRQVLPVRATHIEVVAATPPWTILADATRSATAWRHDGQELALVRTDLRPWQAVYQPAPGVLAWVGGQEVEVQGGPHMQVLLRATLSGDAFGDFAPTVDPLTGDLMMWSGRGLYRLVR
jgi:hypothetical protein